MMDARAVPGPEVVAQARKRLDGVVNCTPVLTCPVLSEQAGCELFLKCENLQHAGAFKFRGASHAIAVLSDDEAARGVAAAVRLRSKQLRGDRDAKAWLGS